jgi:phosphate-selective porin OprO/OprP
MMDAFLELQGDHLRLPNLRVGNFREPFSLERLTGFPRVAFLERALPVNAFAPGRNAGVQLHDAVFDERATWAIGAFTNTGQRLAADGSGASDLTVTGRVTGLPLYQAEGQRLVHLGVAFSARNPKDGVIGYASRPEARSTPVIVNTGPFPASSNTLLGIELAGTFGRSWFMTEFMQSRTQSAAFGDPTFEGYHLQIGHFLTNDNKPYDATRGVFGHPLPTDALSSRDLHLDDGVRAFRHGRPQGAWELVGRLSQADLNDGAIQGGKVTNVSAAVNWYLNAYVRFDLNYVHTQVENQGAANIFLGRLQFSL